MTVKKHRQKKKKQNRCGFQENFQISKDKIEARSFEAVSRIGTSYGQIQNSLLLKQTERQKTGYPRDSANRTENLLRYI